MHLYRTDGRTDGKNGRDVNKATEYKTKDEATASKPRPTLSK